MMRIPPKTARVFSVLAVLVLASCSNEVSFKIEPLNQQTAQSELRERGISIPDSYLLVAMDKMLPPGAGGASYTGAFDSPTPIAPILIDGTPASTQPTACSVLTHDRFPQKWFDIGLDCHTMSDVRLGGGRPLNSSVIMVTIVSGVLPTGKARVYFLAAGN